MNINTELSRLKTSLENAGKTQPLLVAGFVLVTLVLAYLIGWWFLLVGLIIGYVLLVGLSAGAGGAKSPMTILAPAQPSYDLSRLDGRYREAMGHALDVRRKIEAAVAETGDPGLKRALGEATHSLQELTDTIYGLALKAQGVQEGMAGSSTLNGLSDDISRLENAIKGTNDEFQKSQYYATMDSKLQQMQNFTDTKVALDRWDAQLDNALSTLDTILSQVLRIRSSEMLSYNGATDEVSRNLREEVDNLKATSDAFDSLYSSPK